MRNIVLGGLLAVALGLPLAGLLFEHHFDQEEARVSALKMSPQAMDEAVIKQYQSPQNQ